MARAGKYHLCAVDGGGTGCRAAIAGLDGTILSRASGGPANFATNASQAVENVRGAVRFAAAQLGFDDTKMRGLIAHVGLAGIMTEADSLAVASQLPFDICRVSDDREISVIGALGACDGATIAIGTGSFVAARRGGQIRYFGGWGLSVGDQASGARLGRALLERTLLAVDGLGEESDLTRGVLSRFGNSPAEIVAFAATARPADYAALAPEIVQSASAGDVVGQALMTCGAHYLNAALAASGLRGDEVICLIGGIGPHYTPFLAAEYRDRIRPAKGLALDGALQQARLRAEEMESQQ